MWKGALLQMEPIDLSVINRLLAEHEVCVAEVQRRNFLQVPANWKQVVSAGIKVPKYLSTRSIEAIESDLANQAPVQVRSQVLKPGDEVDAAGRQRIFLRLSFVASPPEWFSRYTYIDLDQGTLPAKDLRNLNQLVNSQNYWKQMASLGGGICFAPWPALPTQMRSAEHRHLDRFTDEPTGTSSTIVDVKISKALATALRNHILDTARARDRHPQAAAYISVDLYQPLHFVRFGVLSASDRAKIATPAAGPISARRVHFHQFLPPEWVGDRYGCPESYALDYPSRSIMFEEYV